MDRYCGDIGVICVVCSCGGVLGTSSGFVRTMD